MSKPFAEWTKEEMEADLIGALCQCVRDAGLTMTLHGIPISEQDLRASAERSSQERIIAAVFDAIDRADKSEAAPTEQADE